MAAGAPVRAAVQNPAGERVAGGARAQLAGDLACGLPHLLLLGKGKKKERGTPDHLVPLATGHNYTDLTRSTFFPYRKQTSSNYLHNNTS